MNKHLKEGMRINKLTILKKLDKNDKGYYMWRCSCSCGSKVDRSSIYLSSAKNRHSTASCGCVGKKKLKQIWKKRINRQDREMVGRKFGSWSIIKRATEPNGVPIKYLCECVCGIRKRVSKQSLLEGRSRCCGKAKCRIK